MVHAHELVEVSQAVGSKTPEHDPAAVGGESTELLRLVLKRLEIGRRGVNDGEMVATHIEG
jgi:hypothetical protein